MQGEGSGGKGSQGTTHKNIHKHQTYIIHPATKDTHTYTHEGCHAIWEFRKYDWTGSLTPEVKLRDREFDSVTCRGLSVASHHTAPKSHLISNPSLWTGK